MYADSYTWYSTDSLIQPALSEALNVGPLGPQTVP